MQQKLISDYQDALRISVEHYREALQNMVYHEERTDEITDDDYETLIFPRSPERWAGLNNYRNEFEKLSDLNTAVYAGGCVKTFLDMV